MMTKKWKAIMPSYQTDNERDHTDDDILQAKGKRKSGDAHHRSRTATQLHYSSIQVVSPTFSRPRSEGFVVIPQLDVYRTRRKAIFDLIPQGPVQC
jgi:hypothetical protein